MPNPSGSPGSDSRDACLFHEHLETVNAPVYFYEFMEKADGQSLQDLAEAAFASMLTSGFSREVQTTLEKISSDIIHLGQYMDFVRNRPFRQTLLCRRDLGVAAGAQGRST